MGAVESPQTFMIVTATVYFNTGINKENIYGSTRIQTGTSIDYADCAFKQDTALTTISIPEQYSVIVDADYCDVNGVPYFIDGITMLNDNCALLTISMDALSFIGTENINEISGWCSRKHTDNDTLFGNILPEPFSPSEEMTLQCSEFLSLQGGDTDYLITAASFNLVPADGFNLGQLYSVNENQYVVTPKCPDMDLISSTAWVSVDLPNLGKTYTYHIPQTYLYDTTKYRVQTSLNTVRSLGLDAGISASYRIPSEFVEQVTTAGSDERGSCVYASIRGKSGEIDSGLSLLSGNGVANLKASYMFNTFTVMSVCSGSSMQFNGEEIFNPADTNEQTFKLYGWADVSPTGKPYFAPQYYHGSKEGAYGMAVVGSRWTNQPIAFDVASGSAFTSARRKIDISKQGIDADRFAIRQITESISDATNIAMNALAKNVAGVVSSVAGAGVRYAERQLTGKELALSRQSSALDFEQSNWQAPEIVFPQDDNIQNYIGNKIVVTKTSLSARDRKRFDVFLNMYGYAVSEPLLLSDLTSRPIYNYIKATDVHIVANVARYIREMAEQQIMNGVRIWHEPIDISLYEGSENNV